MLSCIKLYILHSTVDYIEQRNKKTTNISRVLCSYNTHNLIEFLDYIYS